MTELLTAALMRAIEAAAIASCEVTGLELMERAGRGVVEAVFEEWPELAKTSHRAVVLCGPGNNGGDGFVVARRLKEWGWEVEVFLYGDAARLPPDAMQNADRWKEVGAIKDFTNLIAENKVISAFADSFDLVVDAIFGGGLDRPLQDDLRHFIHPTLANPANAGKTVAIDAPTGMCLDSGKELNTHDATVAGLTVTFHRPRTGHFLDGGPGNCGNLKVVDIGLDRLHAGCNHAPSNANKVFRKAWNLSRQEAVRLVNGCVAKHLKKQGVSHKYTHGHALILSGGPGHTGAARLAARGALRIGAGLVTLGVPPAAQSEAAAQLTAIMLARVADADALENLLEDDRINALCIGPGLGLSDEKASLVACALKSGRPLVLDADALTLIARDATLFAGLHDTCILTPHAGEFAKLFPDLAEKLEEQPTRGPAYSKVDATREAAKRAECVVLFKGPDTVIADPSGRCAVNSAHYDRAAAWLATAGSGDVLAGFITGLLARGFAPMQASETAAWLHVECALKFGPGLIAEDLPEMLPHVLQNLSLAESRQR